MSKINRYLSILVIVIFSFVGVIQVNAENTTIYILTKSDGDKIIKIGDAIEGLIKKKGEKYRIKYTGALKKLKLKYRTNPRISTLIQEVTDYLENDTTDLDKLFSDSITTQSGTSTTVNKNDTSKIITPITQTINPTTPITPVIPVINPVINTEYICKSKEYANWYDIAGLIFSPNGDKLAYLIAENQKPDVAPDDYKIVLNGVKSTNYMGWFYKFLPNGDFIYSEKINGKYILMKNGIVYAESIYNTFENAIISPNGKNYALIEWVGTKENQYDTQSWNFVVNGKVIKTILQDSKEKFCTDEIDCFSVNDNGDYLYQTNTWVSTNDYDGRTVKKIYKNGIQLASDNISSFGFKFSNNGTSEAYISQKPNGKYIIIKNGKEFGNEYFGISDLRFLSSSSEIGYIGRKTDNQESFPKNDYAIIKELKEMQVINLNSYYGGDYTGRIAFSNDFLNIAYNDDKNTYLNGNKLPENITKLLRFTFNESNKLELCGYSDKGDGSNIIYINGIYKPNANNMCAMGGGRESPSRGNTLYTESQDGKSYMYNKETIVGNTSKNTFIKDGVEFKTDFQSIDEFGYLPNNNGYYYLGMNKNGKIQLILNEKEEKYCKYIEK